MKTIKVTGNIMVVPSNRQINKKHKGTSFDVKFDFEGNIKVSDLILINYNNNLIKSIILYVVYVKGNHLKALNIDIKDNPVDMIKINDELSVFKTKNKP